MKLTVHHVCGEAFHTDSSNIGKKIHCWKCDQDFVIESNGPHPATSNSRDVDQPADRTTSRIKSRSKTLRIVLASVGALIILVLAIFLANQRPAPAIRPVADMPVQQVPSLALPTPPEQPKLSERQAKLDSILQSHSLKPDISTAIRRFFERKGLETTQVEPFISALPVDTKTKHDLWDAYYTYEPPLSLVMSNGPSAPVKHSTHPSPFRVVPETPTTPVAPPYSLPNGTDIVPPAGPSGRGKLTVNNGTNLDGYVKLAEGNIVRRQPSISKNSSITISNIGDCSCRVLFALGTDWDKNTKQFRRDEIYQEFDSPLVFAQTAHESDHFTISLNPTTDGTAYVHKITKAEFDAAKLPQQN